MLRKTIRIVSLVLLTNFAYADVKPLPAPSRGELLYETHCVTCHNTEMHWRDKKVVTDWASLQAEVGRWQGISGLGWGGDDIAQVTRYLNALYYHYPSPD